MSDEQLKAVSPIDGRYSKKVQHLREIFSESALMRYRVIAEITWLQYLSDCDQMDQIPSMDSQLKDELTKIHIDFSLSDAKKIPIAFVCELCAEPVKSNYRPEIFTDRNYQCVEQTDIDFNNHNA